MDLKIAARMIAVLAVGAAMTAAVMALRGDGPENGMEDAPAQSLHHPGGEPTHAPLGRSELARCRDLGMSAADDAACRKAWAENRRRFFGSERSEPPAVPDTGRSRSNVDTGSEAAIDEEPDDE
ncbi:putative entry exclusion protein TrbK-alt [Agrobacterium tumefaciens]|uniref:putative entry exclusion protein TrbK-alt n=1 Tax=Agrobacterium tumefaciens TaxID=358 RepID=UPI002243122C|nr:putative entry exclusion protein TrbK-alt [Agrobacterium tumefaciens]MCW8057264.1 putative entry exclusion protein TrbK-alt [Agrobacterium tumefaciens]